MSLEGYLNPFFYIYNFKSVFGLLLLFAILFTVLDSKTFQFLTNGVNHYYLGAPIMSSDR